MSIFRPIARHLDYSNTFSPEAIVEFSTKKADYDYSDRSHSFLRSLQQFFLLVGNYSLTTLYKAEKKTTKGIRFLILFV